MRRLALALAITLVAAGSALAAPGDLDTDFGNGGRLIVDFGGLDVYTDVLVQPDGKVVTVGSGGEPGGFRISRVNPDGSSDTGFGEDGTAAPRFAENEYAAAAALGPDGKIVVVGTVGSGVEFDIGVLRLLPNGQPDPSFDGDGLAIVEIGDASSGREVALMEDGSVVVAGQVDAGVAVARLTPAGAPHPIFNDGAPLTISANEAEFLNIARGMALLPDGSIMVAGSVERMGTSFDIVLARVTRFGELDPAFGGGTYRVYDFGGVDFASRIAVQPDGKLVVAGAGGPGGLSAIMRFTAAGDVDESFGNGGIAGAALGEVELEDVVVQANGKLLGLGSSDALKATVMRVQPGGTLDTTFGGDGLVLDAFGGNDDDALAGALQSNGALLVAGTSNSNAALAQLQGDGGRGGGPAPSPGGSGGGPRAGGGGPRGGIPRCGGKRATIVGTAKKDRLKGTRRADVIVALGGGDQIAGGGGSDVICGGDGDDRADGGGGNDRLFGQSGTDKLVGAAGDDRLEGGTGNDTLGGGPGKDRLLGQAGPDRLTGGPGKGDRCEGNAGRDRANCERGGG